MLEAIQNLNTSKCKFKNGTLYINAKAFPYTHGAFGLYFKLTGDIGLKVQWKQYTSIKDGFGFQTKRKLKDSDIWQKNIKELKHLQSHNKIFKNTPIGYEAIPVKIFNLGSYRKSYVGEEKLYCMAGYLMQHIEGCTLRAAQDKNLISSSRASRIKEHHAAYLRKLGIYYEDFHDKNIMYRQGKIYYIDFSPRYVTGEVEHKLEEIKTTGFGRHETTKDIANRIQREKEAAKRAKEELANPKIDDERIFRADKAVIRIGGVTIEPPQINMQINIGPAFGGFEGLVVKAKNLFAPSIKSSCKKFENLTENHISDCKILAIVGNKFRLKCPENREFFMKIPTDIKKPHRLKGKFLKITYNKQNNGAPVFPKLISIVEPKNNIKHNDFINKIAA